MMRKSLKLLRHALNCAAYSLVYAAALLCGRRPLLIRAWVKVRLVGIRRRNWGDELNLYLIRAMTGRAIFFHNYLLPPLQRTGNFLCIGSIFASYASKNSVVWGSGAQLRRDRLKERPSEVRAVRGPLTKQWLDTQGVECPAVYGDPALLLPLFVKADRLKKVRIGLVPHRSDLKHPNFLRVVEKFGSDAIVIDLTRYKDWRDVIYRINQCQCVLSSSLHGLIVADAYGVPNAWAQFSGVIDGDDLKYRDYFLSVDRKTKEPLVMTADVDMREVARRIETEWRPISFDARPLIESCPFLTPEQKERYLAQSSHGVTAPSE